MSERQPSPSEVNDDLYTVYKPNEQYEEVDSAAIRKSLVESGEMTYKEALETPNHLLPKKSPEINDTAEDDVHALSIEDALDENGDFNSAKARQALVAAGVMSYKDALDTPNSLLRGKFETAEAEASHEQAESHPHTKVIEALAEHSDDQAKATAELQIKTAELRDTTAGLEAALEASDRKIAELEDALETEKAARAELSQKVTEQEDRLTEVEKVAGHVRRATLEQGADVSQTRRFNAQGNEVLADKAAETLSDEEKAQNDTKRAFIEERINQLKSEQETNPHPVVEERLFELNEQLKAIDGGAAEASEVRDRPSDEAEASKEEVADSAEETRKSLAEQLSAKIEYNKRRLAQIEGIGLSPAEGKGADHPESIARAAELRAEIEADTGNVAQLEGKDYTNPLVKNEETGELEPVETTSVPVEIETPTEATSEEKDVDPIAVQAESKRLLAEEAEKRTRAIAGLEAGLVAIDAEISAIENNADLSDEEKAAQLEEKRQKRDEIEATLADIKEQQAAAAEKEESTAPSLDGLPARAETMPDAEAPERVKKGWFKRFINKLNPYSAKIAADAAVSEARGAAEDAMFGEYRKAIAGRNERIDRFEADARQENPDLSDLEIDKVVSDKERDFNKSIGNTGWNHIKNLGRELSRKINREDYQSDEEYQDAKRHKRNVAIGAVAIGLPVVLAGTMLGMKAAGAFDHIEGGIEQAPQQSDLGSMEARDEGLTPREEQDIIRQESHDGSDQEIADNASPEPGEYTADNIDVSYEEYLSDEKISAWAMGTRMDMTSTETAMDDMWSLGEADPAHAAQMSIGFLSDGQLKDLGLEDMTPQQIEDAMHDDTLRAETLNLISESLDGGNAKVEIVDNVSGEFYNWGAAPVDTDGNIISMEEARAQGITDTELNQEVTFLSGVSLLRVTDDGGNVSYFNSECKNFLTEAPTPGIIIVESDPISENPGTSPDGGAENPSDQKEENPSDPNAENPSDEIEENPKTEDPGEYPTEPDAENPSDPTEENPSDEKEENPSDEQEENPSDPKEENPSDEIEENPKSEDPDDYEHDTDAPDAEVDPDQGETEPPEDVSPEDSATAEEEPGDEVGSDHNAGTADEANPVNPEGREHEIEVAPRDDSAPSEEDPGTEVQGPATPPAPQPVASPDPAPMPAPVSEPAPAPQPAPAPVPASEPAQAFEAPAPVVVDVGGGETAPPEEAVAE